MTREEAIKHLRNDWFMSLGGQLCVDEDKKDAFLEAVGMGIKALRPVSREQVDVVIKSLKFRLENNEEGGVVYIPKFAVERMIERLEAIENG